MALALGIEQKTCLSVFALRYADDAQKCIWLRDDIEYARILQEAKVGNASWYKDNCMGESE